MKTIKIPYYTSSLDLHVDEKNLEAVITARTDEYEAGKSEEELVKEALAAFYWLRELRGIEKKPSTSELVDWLRALVAGGVVPERIEREIPFAGVLLKKDKDLQTLGKARR